MVTTNDMWERFMNSPSLDCLDLFENEYKNSGELGDLHNHNLVLMDVGRWEQVKQNCTRIIKEAKYSYEVDFIEAGIAEWFLGDKSSAIQYWKKSLRTQFAACPGAPDGTLILWYAGQLLDDNKLVTQSMKKIKQYWKVQDYSEFKGWMGPVAIAGFIMDKVPVDIFLNEWKLEESTGLEARRFCRAHFWVGMKLLDQNQEQAIKHFKAAYSADKRAILEYEYFLAKWEYARLTGQNLWDDNQR